MSVCVCVCVLAGVHTLASSETEVQYPPLRENFPLPMRARISSGVSSGPLANGVKLETEEEEHKKGGGEEGGGEGESARFQRRQICIS